MLDEKKRKKGTGEPGTPKKSKQVEWERASSAFLPQTSGSSSQLPQLQLQHPLPSQLQAPQPLPMPQQLQMPQQMSQLQQLQLLQQQPFVMSFATHILARFSPSLDPLKSYLTLNLVFIQPARSLRELLGVDSASLSNICLYDAISDRELEKLSKFRKQVLSSQGQGIQETFHLMSPYYQPREVVLDMRLLVLSPEIPPVIICSFSQVDQQARTGTALEALSTLAKGSPSLSPLQQQPQQQQQQQQLTPRDATTNSVHSLLT